MFSFLRIPIFLLAFVFVFFGSKGVAYAESNPTRLLSRIEADKNSAVSAVLRGAPSGIENVYAEASARGYDFTILRNMQIKFATVLFAPEARADEPAIVPAPAAIEQSDLQKIIEALGGLKGAGALGIAFAIVQILMVLIKAIWNPSGGWQLTAVLGLSVAAALLSGMVVGKMEFLTALTAGPVLAAVQVLANQIFKKATA